jgi:hypothetical protein
LVCASHHVPSPCVCVCQERVDDTLQLFSIWCTAQAGRHQQQPGRITAGFRCLCPVCVCVCVCVVLVLHACCNGRRLLKHLMVEAIATTEDSITSTRCGCCVMLLGCICIDTQAGGIEDEQRAIQYNTILICFSFLLLLLLLLCSLHLKRRGV